MQCLVFVKFLEGGSLSPEEFFTRIRAQWSWVDYAATALPGKAGVKSPFNWRKVREAMCIADYNSFEQLTIDLSIMPGAGISGVEIYPITKNREALSEYTEDMSLA